MMHEMAQPMQQEHEQVAAHPAAAKKNAAGIRDCEYKYTNSPDAIDQAAASARSAFKDMSCSTSCGCCRCQETNAECPEDHSWQSKMLRWWVPRRVVPVEHARECLCSLVDASHSFVGAIGARRPRRAAGAGLLGLAVGSFCCAAAATKMRASPVWLPQLLRVLLALVALCGFARLFSKHLWQMMPQRALRIVVAYIAATALSSAAVTVAAVIAVATAARMYVRAAVDYGTRNEPRRWVSVALDLLERGALLLQMILMTQWVFGEFSVMPVMTTMGMMFALLHNCGGILYWEDDF